MKPAYVFAKARNHLFARHVEEGKDDEGRNPPQDEEQVQELEDESSVAEEEEPRKEHCLPCRGLGESRILLPPLHAY